MMTAKNVEIGHVILVLEVALSTLVDLVADLVLAEEVTLVTEDVDTVLVTNVVFIALVPMAEKLKLMIIFLVTQIVLVVSSLSALLYWY